MSMTSESPKELQPDGLARRLFVITVIGVLAYITVVISLMSSAG